MPFPIWKLRKNAAGREAADPINLSGKRCFLLPLFEKFKSEIRTFVRPAAGDGEHSVLFFDDLSRGRFEPNPNRLHQRTLDAEEYGITLVFLLREFTDRD